MNFIVARLLAASLLMTLLIGCGGGEQGAPTVKVSGKVTFDGAPLEKGTITFEPSNDKGGPSSAAIQSGAYTADVELGPKRVRFSAVKVLGKKKVYEGSADSPEEDITEQLIPDKYNAASNESYTVKAAASDANFDLKSK